MKKYLLIVFVSLFLCSNTSAEEMQEYSFNCKELSFAINPSVSTINFLNIDLFAIAEMVSNIPIGYTLNSEKTINAKYHGYNTTVIELKFDKEIKKYVDGEAAAVEFSFDDNDGIYVENQFLQCEVRVKKM